MTGSLVLRLCSLALVVGLQGCAAAQAQRAGAQGTAVVDVAALMRVHPFASVLAQYDREIEALRSTALTAGSAETSDALHAAESGFARERSENALVQSRLRAHAAEYANRENAQLAALAASPEQPAGGVRTAIDAAYRAQASDVRDRAASSYARYQAALGHQRGDALAALRASLDASLRREYAAAAQRVAERESDDNVALVSASAAERLNLRLRLRNPYTGSDRQAILAQLAALDRRQRDALAAERARDDRALAKQRAAMQARNDAEFARLARDLDQKIAANATERRAVLTAQANPPQLTGLNEPAQPDVDINAEARAFRANAPPVGKDVITPALAAADAEVKANIARVEAADRTSRANTNAEIESLRRRRDALAAAMRAQILRLARSDANGRDVVDAGSGRRASDAKDVTSAVAADLKRLSI